MQGKVVLVTGGAKRVGAAICRRLHAAGAELAVHYHSSAQEALALQDELNKLRPKSAAAFQADLLDLNALPKLVHKVIKKFGQLDALVNNASSFYATPLAEVNEQQWHDLLGTNLRAPLFLAQAAAAELRRRHGCIVNIADIHAERPMHGHLLYSVAKAVAFLIQDAPYVTGQIIAVDGGRSINI